MAKVKIVILASDIRELKYVDSKVCAITRAVQRTGHPKLVKGEHSPSTHIEDEFGRDIGMIDYDTHSKVLSMYIGALEESNQPVHSGWAAEREKHGSTPPADFEAFVTLL